MGWDEPEPENTQREVKLSVDILIGIAVVHISGELQVQSSQGITRVLRELVNIDFELVQARDEGFHALSEVEIDIFTGVLRGPGHRGAVKRGPRNCRAPIVVADTTDKVLGDLRVDIVTN